MKYSISLKLFSGGKLVFSTRSTRKKRIFHLLREEKWEKAYIKVTYRPGFINEGEYSDYLDTKKAINQFTEDDERC